MAKIKKSTKKFARKHLAKAISSRKARSVYKKNRSTDGQDESRDIESNIERAQSVIESLSGDEKILEELEADNNLNQDEQSDPEDAPVLDDLENEIEAHKEQLKKLKDEDPEFYKYLEENDAELLGFGDSDSEDGGDNDDDIIEDECDAEKDAESDVVKRSLLDKLSNSIGKFSMRSVKQLIKMFENLVTRNDGDGDNDEANMRFEDDNTYNRLVVMSLQMIPPTYRDILKLKDESVLPTSAPTWKKHRSSIKKYLRTLMNFLEQLNDTQMLHFALQSMIKAGTIQLISGFHQGKFGRQFLKCLMNFWTLASADKTGGIGGKTKELASKDSVRILAFVAIRKLTMQTPTEFSLICLKAAYTYFLRSTKQNMAVNMGVINFLANCLVELYGLDYDQTYQQAFVGIRQIAVQLRLAVTQPSADKTKSVYNWQVVYALKMWSRVLSAYCSKQGNGGSLETLIYPLTQTIFGVLTLQNAPEYHPLRIHLLRSLNELAMSTGTYIPTACYVVELIQEEIIRGQKAKASTLKQFDIRPVIRCQKNYLNTKIYFEMIVEAFTGILLEQLAINSTSIGFPELSVPVYAQLKKLVKGNKNAKTNRLLAALADKIEQNVQFIREKRSRVEFSPIDYEKCKQFASSIEMSSTPIGAYQDNLNKIKMQLHNIAQ